MFHRLQGQTHQFIRSTYDVESKRSKQKVVYTHNQYSSFYDDDEKLADLTSEERDYLRDWFKAKQAAEKAQANKLTSQHGKHRLENLLEALKDYPPTYEDASDMFAVCAKLARLLKPIKEAGMAKIPGIVAPEPEQDLGAQLVSHLGEGRQ